MHSETQEDEAISSYLSFTNTSDIQAARKLRLANGNLETAVEAYLDSTSTLSSSNNNHNNQYEQLSLDDSYQSDCTHLLPSDESPDSNCNATSPNHLLPGGSARSSNRPTRAFEPANRPRRSSSKLFSFFFRLWIGPFRLIAIPVSFVADLGLTVFSLIGRLLGLRLPTMSFHWPRPSTFNWGGEQQSANRSKDSSREMGQRIGGRITRSLFLYYHCSRRRSFYTQTPEFLLLGYDDAVQKAKDELKVLMVVLVSEEHDDVHQFKRGTLMDEELLNLLRTKDILVWGGDVKGRDASFAAHVLDATTYPFVAFISLQAKRPSSTVTTITSSVNRSSSNVIRSICATINSVVIPRTNGHLSRLRTEKARRESDRRLREEQDRAYAEAGRLDRERVMKKKAELEAERKRLEEIKSKELERERARQLKLEEAEQKRRWRYWARQENKSFEPPTSGGVTIGFRLGDGRRVVRKFKADDTLESLYLFVELESTSSLTAQDHHQNSTPPPRPSPDYRHSYSFKLSTAMPRRILPLPETSSPSKLSTTSGHQQTSTIAQFGGLDGANVNVEGNVVGRTQTMMMTMMTTTKIKFCSFLLYVIFSFFLN
ncbi:hypothetical protein Pst134EA_031578 [Puccinia striiformis f. sp. tritici]|uniref:uncharacterized protein n=1 Tax=Puccinia striiformis f. sp. tritici TaxID=168172 RepID=UPI002007EE9B|nr:uncharacterized protein Pst134EA_031578 [Puccinia striiformis f. sp. tritici]KAH9442761.1 hypothetical protein Pst134EA_031578 [Puccinia striiformis f. sp. tritici]